MLVFEIAINYQTHYALETAAFNFLKHNSMVAQISNIFLWTPEFYL